MSALENIDYYHALRVPDDATPEEVKKGFYRSALKYHPDRSNNADTSEEFQLAKKAFSVLSNDRLRRIYDEARKEERLRTIGGRKGQAPGDLEIDPQTVRPDALVITCDFCRRPSSDKCGVCQLNMCGPCKFKPHQAPGFRMHWPFVSSSKFSLKLIQQQKEREEKERLKLMWYGDSEEARKKREHAFLQIAKACRDSSKLKYGEQDWASHFHLELGMFYAWTQDESSVCIAVRLPAADTARKVTMNAEGDRLIICQEGMEEPILDRRMVQRVPQQEVQMYTMDSLQHCVILLEKSPWMPAAATHWRRLFEGDSDYCRYSGPQPYTVSHPEEGWTHVTIPLPAEAAGTDVDVRVDTNRLEVQVGDVLRIERHFREHLTAQRTDSTWRLDIEESGEQRLVVIMRTFEEFGTWGGHLNEERRTSTIPTRAYVNCEESVPVLFQEDHDPQMVMAACTAVLHMEHGDKFLSRTSLGVDATNYLGVLDGTGTPPPQYTNSKPEIDYSIPYPWSQTRTTVEIQIPIPRQYLDAVEVHIGTRDLRVIVGGTPMSDVCGDLFGPVLGDDSFWDLDRDDAILTIGLAKIEVGDPKLREDKGEWKRFLKRNP
eukprot:GGOE01000459.1.p1 GENE.GGOE01000459.1~~GGOE01000459.1.p1  ORF type:complete len:668 (+),score=151.80 GGOE01000459.1:200-2005(+)